MTGSEAMMVDSHQCPVGSYCCCQPPLTSGSRRMTTAMIIATRVKTTPNQPTEAGGGAAVWDDFTVAEVPAMRAPPGRNNHNNEGMLPKCRQNLTRQTVS